MIDPGIVGRSIEAQDAVWDRRDVMMYALGVGAGQSDPCEELELTTENSSGKALRVLPTFGAVIAHGLVRSALDIGATETVIHAEQAVEMPAPLPVCGSARLTGRITSIYDKGSGALITIEGAAHHRVGGELLVRTRSSLFVRGAGGFGGDRGPATSAADIPDRAPDHELTARIPADQALLYRLSGDRNPLHVDPVVARRAGFERPILHGLCTYGYAGRLLLHAACGADPARMRSIAVRFSGPVTPGGRLTVRAWREGDRLLFRALTGEGRIVLDRGVVTTRPTRGST